jgi:insertion element IS1 protein InsB
MAVCCRVSGISRWVKRRASYIERLNNTLRQGISRLVRKSLSFSKKLENYIGAIWTFIRDYNQKVCEKLQREQMTAFSPSFT